MHQRKKLLLRIESSLWKEITHWAEQDLRSINGQIEFVLQEAVKKRKRNQQEHLNYKKNMENHGQRSDAFEHPS